MSESESVTDTQPTESTAGSKFLRFVQWMTFVLTVALVAMSTTTFQYLKVPNAPVLAFWSMVAGGLLLIVSHASPIFFRLPRRLKQAAYAAIPVYTVCMLSVFGLARAAFEETPQGQIEVRAEEKENARLAAQAQMDAETKTRQEMVAAQSAKKKAADEAESFLAKNPAFINGNNWSCRNLIDSVIAMSQDRPLQIYEINSPTEISNIPTFKIQCFGSAEWSNGSDLIHYGARMSEGGNLILEYRQGR